MQICKDSWLSQVKLPKRQRRDNLIVLTAGFNLLTVIVSPPTVQTVT